MAKTELPEATWPGVKQWFEEDAAMAKMMEAARKNMQAAIEKNIWDTASTVRFPLAGEGLAAIKNEAKAASYDDALKAEFPPELGWFHAMTSTNQVPVAQTRAGASAQQWQDTWAHLDMSTRQMIADQFMKSPQGTKLADLVAQHQAQQDLFPSKPEPDPPFGDIRWLTERKVTIHSDSRLRIGSCDSDINAIRPKWTREPLINHRMLTCEQLVGMPNKHECLGVESILAKRAEYGIRYENDGLVRYWIIPEEF